MPLGQVRRGPKTPRCGTLHARSRLTTPGRRSLRSRPGWFGPPTEIKGLLDDLKPALLTTVQAEFDKVADQKPPPPTRFLRGETAVVAGSSGGAGAGSAANADPASAAAAAASALDELFPRVDLRPLITAKVLADMNDKNWKVREEAMQEALRILEEVKRIQPATGDLLPAVKARLVDSNKNLAVLALQILGATATAMGKPIGKEYKRWTA